MTCSEQNCDRRFAASELHYTWITGGWIPEGRGVGGPNQTKLPNRTTRHICPSCMERRMNAQLTKAK